MNSIDYPALLAELERQRATAVQEITDLDVIIVAVRKRAEPMVPAGLTLSPPRKTAGNGKPAKAVIRGSAKGGAAHLNADQVATMRTQYEGGVATAEIASRLGVSTKAVYKRATKSGWKRSKDTAKETAKPAPTPAGHKLSGTVRCDHCERMTGYDPCEHCHKTLTRKW